MMEAQRAQYGGGGGFGGRSGGGYGMRGGRPGPYDRMGGAPLGRGFGAGGPGMRGRQMKGGKLYFQTDKRDTPISKFEILILFQRYRNKNVTTSFFLYLSV